jgi:hypothetical protein
MREGKTRQREHLRRPGRGELPAASTRALVLAVAVAVVVAAVVGVRGRGVEPRLPLPAEAAPGWGQAWSGAMETASEVTATELGQGVVLVAAALGALALLALLSALLLALGAREAVRPSLAVRWTQGASPGRLARERVGVVQGDVVRASLVGALAGVGLAYLLFLSWPVTGEAREAAPLLAFLVPCLPALLIAAALWPVVGLEARAPALLRVGAGVTDDPRAGTVRRGAATVQMATAFALVLAGVSLVGGPRSAAPAVEAGSDSLVIPLRPLVAGVDWGQVERLLGATAPESLTTVGAWTGHGTQDLVTVECGACSLGGLPLPIYGVRATLHAVSSGFFEAAGMPLLAGRGFTGADRSGAAAVGIVTRAFARDHFENGDPLGHRILLSGPGQRWVTVVGVVEPLPFQAPGAPAPDDPVLYLSLAQHPADAVEWAVPGAGRGADDRVLARNAPVTVAGSPERVSERRARALAPVRWSGTLLLLVGALGVSVALVGAAATAAAEVRGRWREAAVRAAMGASPWSLARRFLGRILVTALLALGAGWVVAWSLVATAGSGDGLRSGAGALLACALLAAALGGGWTPARRAGAVEPARLLREG